MTLLEAVNEVLLIGRWGTILNIPENHELMAETFLEELEQKGYTIVSKPRK